MVDPRFVLEGIARGGPFWHHRFERSRQLRMDAQTRGAQLHLSDGRTDWRVGSCLALVCITLDYAHAVPCLGAKIVIDGRAVGSNPRSSNVCR